ncbi:MAG: hypothetical protein WCW13_00770 [archaeon]
MRVPVKFSAIRAAKLSRVGNRANGVTRRLKSSANSIDSLVYSVGDEVLKRLPVRASTNSAKKHELSKSLSRKAADSFKGVELSPLHCLERCNLALGLLRKLKVPAWLARQVYLDTSSYDFRLHDYVEFFSEGKVKTLVFGYSPEGRDYNHIFPFAANKIHPDGGIGSVVFRGVDGSQIAGVVDSKKLRIFLINPINSKQATKDRKRIELMVKHGVIPKEALSQIK